MINTAAIIAQMRRMVKVDTSQYSDADALIDLNTLKDSFWSALITTVNEDYSWDRWLLDLTTTNTEYLIPTVAYNTAGAKLLKGISIAYSSDTYTNSGLLQYLPAREVNPNTLEKDWYYYVENQSQLDPIYYVSDNSFFIAPAFTTANLVDRIKLTGIRKIVDYTLATTEANMKIPVDQQSALSYGLAVFGLMNKGVDDNLINNAESRWERKKQEAIKSLSIRVENPTTFTYPTYDSDEIILNRA